MDLLYQSTGTEIYSFDVSSNNTTTILATKSLVASGLNGASGMAFDQSGNLYVAEYGTKSILKIQKGGAISTFFTDSLGTKKISFDTAGNLYAGTPYAGGYPIREIAPNGTSSNFVTTPWDVTGMAFDSSGNLFFSTGQNNQIIKVSPDGLTSSVFYTFAFPERYTSPIAFDSQDNLYVGLYFSDSAQINMLTPAGTSTVLTTFPGVSSASVIGLAIDAQDRIFISGPEINYISKLKTDGSIDYSFYPGTIGGGSLVFGPEVVPEPSTYALGAVATGAMVFVMRRRKQGQK